MIKPQEINQDGLPVFNLNETTDDGLPILKKKEPSVDFGLKPLLERLPKPTTSASQSELVSEERPMDKVVRELPTKVGKKDPVFSTADFIICCSSFARELNLVTLNPLEKFAFNLSSILL